MPLGRLEQRPFLDFGLVAPIRSESSRLVCGSARRVGAALAFFFFLPVSLALALPLPSLYLMVLASGRPVERVAN